MSTRNHMYSETSLIRTPTKIIVLISKVYVLIQGENNMSFYTKLGLSQVS